ncbi:MAG: hypothetical protein ACK5MR_10100 [Cumulibacter sp.]
MRDYIKLKETIKRLKDEEPKLYADFYKGLKFIVSREFCEDFELIARVRLMVRELNMGEKKFVLSTIEQMEEQEKNNAKDN